MCNLMTRGIVIVLFGATVPVIAGEQRSAPSSEQQIEEALSSLPETLREGVAVVGFGESGELVTLQEGGGLITCLAEFGPANTGGAYTSDASRPLDASPAPSRVLTFAPCRLTDQACSRIRAVRGDVIEAPKQHTITSVICQDN